jgi:hypothetical protein
MASPLTWGRNQRPDHPLPYAGGYDARMRYVFCSFVGGVIVGALGFIAGFFGPILFTPESNRPLLGIFITGGRWASSLASFLAASMPQRIAAPA